MIYVKHLSTPYLTNQSWAHSSNLSSYTTNFLNATNLPVSKDAAITEAISARITAALHLSHLLGPFLLQSCQVIVGPRWAPMVILCLDRASPRIAQIKWSERHGQRVTCLIFIVLKWILVATSIVRVRLVWLVKVATIWAACIVDRDIMHTCIGAS